MTDPQLRFSYGYKVTDCCGGHSLWHRLAARMLSVEETVSFLNLASAELSANTLLDDLREAMTVFPPELETLWMAHSPLLRGDWTWSEFRTRTAWRTPFEISALSGLPLIDAIVLAQVKPLHRVIQAAQAASVHNLTAETTN